ncbi:MAG: nucleotidyltransferase substrate binding protein [Rickettsiales bacterium]|nr:nucleotidyltransferase substrate binding protein [Rickettsiales bacterium]
MSHLILEPLEKAITQLEIGMALKEQSSDNELLRDGVIQRFEYTIDLAWKLLAYLRDAFSESNLPYKVDIVDWNTLSDDFKKIVQQDKILLHY